MDPLLTVLISLYILKESFSILKETTNIVLMASPVHLSIEDINNRLTTIDGINNIHHVHLWQMDEHDIHFEAHVDITDRMVSETNTLLKKIEDLLREAFKINHVTLQFECDACIEKELLFN